MQYIVCSVLINKCSSWQPGRRGLGVGCTNVLLTPCYTSRLIHHNKTHTPDASYSVPPISCIQLTFGLFSACIASAAVEHSSCVGLIHVSAKVLVSESSKEFPRPHEVERIDIPVEEALSSSRQ